MTLHDLTRFPAEPPSPSADSTVSADARPARADSTGPAEPPSLSADSTVPAKPASPSADSTVPGDDGTLHTTDGGPDVDLVIVGGGPRAVSTIERLTARGATDLPVRVVVVDAFEVAAGATWRTDQSPQLLNNTYSAHTTIYPDDSTPMSGPITPGPDLVAWAHDVVAGAPRTTADPSAGWSAGPRPEWIVREAAAVEPWSFPTRRLQGVYFREQLEAILARGGVELTGVVGTVVGIDPAGTVLSAETELSAGDGDGAAQDEVGSGRTVLSAESEPRARDGGPPTRVVRLADGRVFRASAVVLAQGMVQGRRTADVAERAAAAERHALTYIEPGMPAERDWDAVPAGEDVLVAGLGANFFDVVAVLTAGRGGRFVPGDDPFDLSYEVSGREPRLLVGSRRGLPYRSKSWYGGLPPAYQPQLATPEWFAAAAEVLDQDFTRDIWPQLAREFVIAHLATLAAHHPSAVPGIVTDDDGTRPGFVDRPAVAGDGRLVRDDAGARPGSVDRPAVAGTTRRVRGDESAWATVAGASRFVRDEDGALPVASRRPSGAPEGLADAAAHGQPLAPATAADPRRDPAVVALPAVVLDRIAATEAVDLPALVRELVAGPEWWLDPGRLDRPGVLSPSPDEWHGWTRRWREAELASITSPLTSPRATVNRAMAALRGQVARLVKGGAIGAASATRDVNGWFGALGLALASGPPPERTALLLALVKAGVVQLLGEGTAIGVEGGDFVARSQVVDREHRAGAFVETRMSKGHVDVTDDPLLRSLLDAGRARLFTRRGPDGQLVTTRSLDVTHEEFWLVDADGRPDPQVIVIGIPASDVQPGSAIGATPGVPSPLIAGADRAAEQVGKLVRETVPVG